MARRRTTQLLVAGLLASGALSAMPARAAVEDGVELRAGGADTQVRRLAPAAIAGRTFAAPPTQVLEILLADGTMLALAPGSRVRVGCYAVDGCLDLTLVQGAVRVASRPLAQAPVTIATPAGDVALDGGAATARLGSDGELRAALLFGPRLTVAHAGTTRTVRLPGYAVTGVAGAAPAAPERRADAEIEAEIALFNPPAGFVAIAPAAGSPDDDGAQDRASANEADDTDPSDRTVATSTGPSTGGGGSGTGGGGSGGGGGTSSSGGGGTTNGGTSSTGGGGTTSGGTSSTGGGGTTSGGTSSTGGGGTTSGGTSSTGGGSGTAEPLVFAAASLNGANPFGGTQSADYAVDNAVTPTFNDQPGSTRTLAQARDPGTPVLSDRLDRFLPTGPNLAEFPVPVEDAVGFPGLTTWTAYPQGERFATTEAELVEALSSRPAYHFDEGGGRFVLDDLGAELSLLFDPLLESDDVFDLFPLDEDLGLVSSLRFPAYSLRSVSAPPSDEIARRRVGESEVGPHDAVVHVAGAFENATFPSAFISAIQLEGLFRFDAREAPSSNDLRAVADGWSALRPRDPDHFVYVETVGDRFAPTLYTAVTTAFESVDEVRADPQGFADLVGVDLIGAPTFFEDFDIFDDFVLFEGDPVDADLQPDILAFLYEKIREVGPDTPILASSLGSEEILDEFGDTLRVVRAGGTLISASEFAGVGDVGTAPDSATSGGFVFATGGVDRVALGGSTRREDVFAVGAGLGAMADGNAVPAAVATPDPARAFLRRASRDGAAGSLDLADTGLRVLGTPAASLRRDFTAPNPERSVAVHADFGIAGLGDPTVQRSTISVTLGDVAYDVRTGYQPIDELRAQTERIYFGTTDPADYKADPAGDDTTPHETVLTARTIGTTRGVGDGAGAVAATSDLFTTAAGGGNPNFQDGEGRTLGGRAGYFVLDNYDPVADPAVGARYAEGGEERPSTVAPGAGQRFALQRLAFGVDSRARAPAADIVLAGFAAGLGEAPAGDGLVVEPLRTAEGGFRLESDAASNRLTVTADLVPLRRPADATTVTLGGTDPDVFGASAYLDADRFAARSPRNVGMPDDARGDGDDLAMITADLLAEGAATANAETQALLAAMSGEPDYKWGFFFGDAEVGSARVHTHLGTWVAGRFTDPDVLDGWENEDAGRIPGGGTATYTGPAIGNVADRGATATAIGTYTNAWDFAAREGETELAFDGATMTGTTTNPAGTAGIRGRLGGEGTARRAEIRGAFVGGGDNALPSAQIGSFAVSDGAGYTAAGTFAGKRSGER